MGIKTKRVRDGNGDITQLDLTDADAANRRLSVPAEFSYAGKRFIGFSWVKSTTQSVNIDVYRVDEENSSKLYLLEAVAGDTTTSGTWRPPAEELSGMDIDDPSLNSGVGYRLQFSQAGGACSVDATADFKEI